MAQPSSPRKTRQKKWIPILFVTVTIPLGCLIQVACERHVAAGVPLPPSVADAPSVAARIALVEGLVSLQPAGIDDWTPAELNRTLTTGDSLWTSGNGRAEIGSGSTAMRLDANTNFRLLQLNDNLTQVSVTSGTFNVRLRRLDDDEAFEIDTPDAVITLLRIGDYRAEVDATGNVTRLTVRTGQAQVDSGRESFSVRPEQQATFGGALPSGYQITGAPVRDSFDTFCANRDQRQDRAESARYISPEVTGYHDLDGYGTWSIDVTWGSMWCPVGVPVGWAPYRFGHWLWVEPWGWIWVDDAPWGFAPFHYGRWIYSTSWCWLPGPRMPRPVYSGGLVVFVGGGRPGFSYYVWLGAGTGVGWFPLGPGEIYFPPYRASRRYLVNINVTNTVIRDARMYDQDASRQRYMHQGMSRAITVVPRDGFVRGQPISRMAVNLPDREVSGFKVHGSSPPVSPTRDSIGPAGRAPRPPSSANRAVLTQREPPRIVPFERKQQQLDRNPGRPIEGQPAEELRRNAPAPNVRQIPQPTRQTPQATPPQRPAGPAAGPAPTQTGQRPGARPQVTPPATTRPATAPPATTLPPTTTAPSVPSRPTPSAQESRRAPVQTQQPQPPQPSQPQRAERTDQRRVDQRSKTIQRERQREDSIRRRPQGKQGR